MMKQGLFILSFIFSACLSAQVDSFNYMVGNVLYEQGNYTDAIKVYENVIAQNGYSSQVNYNLGNAYYKTNKIGKSILNYERALLLNPGDPDIQYNLDLANLRIRDQLDKVDEVIFAIWWRHIHQFFTTTVWGYISVILIWLAIIGLGFYRYSNQLGFQKTGFYIFLICSLLFIFSIAATFASDRYRKTHQYAIIMEPSAILKSEPNESSTNLLLIHEGLKVQLLGEDEQWIEVKLDNGYEGWVMSEAIEKI